MPELLRAVGGPPVETHRRLPGRQPLDLDVAPADAANAQAEHLRDGLLGGPAAGHRLGPTPDVPLLGLGQDPSREPLPEPLEGRPDAIDLDDVDPEFGRPRWDRDARHRRAIRP